jgi:hypothetical protein
VAGALDTGDGAGLLGGVALAGETVGLGDWVVSAAACGLECGWCTKAKPQTATAAATRVQTAMTRGDRAERRLGPSRKSAIVTGTSGLGGCSDISSPEAVALPIWRAWSHGTHISTLPRAPSTTNGRSGLHVGLPGVTLGNSSWI